MHQQQKIKFAPGIVTNHPFSKSFFHNKSSKIFKYFSTHCPILNFILVSSYKRKLKRRGCICAKPFLLLLIFFSFAENRFAQLKLVMP